ncbi:MAG TPA: hypothetical protein VKS81_04480, partial [Bacteroidota bacterium]|nr:hypothetical protein [Bacteroidota bacterium]
MSKFFAVVVALLGSLNVALAQGGGSAYTRYGLGDLQYYETGSAVGRGGTGLSVFSPDEIDMINPANLAGLTLTRFSLSGAYQGYSISDNTGSANYGTTSFTSGAIAIPIVPA